MRKLSFWYLYLLFPLSVSAQGQTLLKDFEQKVSDVDVVVRLNEHLNVAQITLQDDNFELVAVDDKMQVPWRTPLKGKPVGTGNFKGHLLTIASIASSKSKDAPRSYLAYLVDEQTGKVLQQKEIYTSNATNREATELFFGGNASRCKLLIRETGSNEHGTFFTLSKFSRTKSLTAIEIDDNLQATVTKPNIPDGYYVGCSAGIDDNFLFYVLQNDGTLKVAKFDPGKSEPSASITQNLDIKPESFYDDRRFACAASQSEYNVAYFSMIHKNSEKDYELSLCKLDFNNSSAKVINEVLTKDHMKSIEKSFSVADGKIDHPDMGSGFLFMVKHIEDFGGLLLVSFGAEFMDNPYDVENATVINAYDKDLTLKFQQVFPNITVHPPTSDIKVDYHRDGNNLYLVSVTGTSRYYTIYGELDLTSGKWIKLQRLEREGLASPDYTNRHNLWYKDNFILIYVPFSNFANAKLDLSLQSNAY